MFFTRFPCASHKHVWAFCWARMPTAGQGRRAMPGPWRAHSTERTGLSKFRLSALAPTMKIRQPFLPDLVPTMKIRLEHFYQI